MPFRLSLVYKAYSGTKAELSPFRRFTYFVRPGAKGNTTFKRQVGGCPFDSLEAVKKSFSLEPVNKEFYRAIQKHFYGLVGGKVEKADYTGCMSLPSLPITAPENHKAYQEFAVRLLGRVVFCWFLKHKRCNEDRPLIPHELLSSEAVEKHSGYYHAVLEKLFFQTLNKPMNERSKYAPEFAHLIPYLNGGLFDPHRDDFYEEGALGISRYINTLTVPDRWFKELFETLEQYNFTIDENTSLDTDVSIDPEILGRIFENLLAEINPETGDSARKATGSFYTPREIVDYMVEESLIQHLKTALGLTTEHTEHTEGESSCVGVNPVYSVYSVVEKNLRDLFVDDDQPHNLDDKTRRAVVDAFRTIKVLDPACGSGAFPVGILQKMLCALRKVDPENDLWLDAQIEQIHSMKLTQKEEDRRLAEIEHAFETNEADYGRKLGIIQNSVYGVDIQPIAIEISKLRFFLTLVVDEKINEKEENRGILPLPNLDFKFVCANTLIPAPEIENKGELDLEYYPDFFKDFTLLTEQYFYAGTPAEKQRIRTKLSECVHKKVKGELDKVQMIQGNDLLENAGLSAAKRKAIAERRKQLIRNVTLWRSYQNIFTGETVGFFDPKYMFPDAGAGFDVVIANPPYVRQEEIKELKPAFEAEYTCYTGTADLLIYFYERGCRLLKENGVLTYITSNQYFRAGYGKKLRGYLAKKMRIHQLIDFGDAPVFDATAYPSIIVMTKTVAATGGRGSRSTPATTENEFLALNWTPGDPVAGFVDIFQTRAFSMKQSYLTSEGWKLELPQVFALMQKLCAAGKPLGEYVEGRFYRGVTTGCNEAFVIDRTTRDQLIAEAPKSREIIKPYFRGKDVKRWVPSSADLWLIFPRRGVDINCYPAVKKHLSTYKKQLMPGSDGGRKPGSYKWYEIQDDTKYWEEFSFEKVIYPDIAQRAEFAFDSSQAFLANTLYLIPTAGKFVLGLLNSNVIWWFYNQISPKIRGGFVRFISQYVSQIPIPSATPAQQAGIEALVEQILVLKKENPADDVFALEAEIDQLVYKLYDLTEEEIVEGRS